MTWRNPRSRRVPGNWKLIRKAILERDSYTCRIAGPYCTGLATEVDHINRLGPDEDWNLWGVCSVCHREKTKDEAREAIQEYRERGYRPRDEHPGSI